MNFQRLELVGGLVLCVVGLDFRHQQHPEESSGSKTIVGPEAGAAGGLNFSSSCAWNLKEGHLTCTLHHSSLALNQQPVEPRGQEPVGDTRGASPSHLSFSLTVSEDLSRRKRIFHFIVASVTETLHELLSRQLRTSHQKPNIHIVFSSAWFWDRIPLVRTWTPFRIMMDMNNLSLS